MEHNQNYQFFDWPTLQEVGPRETLGFEKFPQYIYIYIDREEILRIRAEIAGIQEQISKLEERLIHVGKQQIVPIQFLESKKLQLKQPIYVSLSYSSEAGIWIVDSPELNLYGEGEDENQAIEDFKIILEETYFSLKKDKERLGPELKRKWDILQQIIHEK